MHVLCLLIFATKTLQANKFFAEWKVSCKKQWRCEATVLSFAIRVFSNCIKEESSKLAENELVNRSDLLARNRQASAARSREWFSRKFALRNATKSNSSERSSLNCALDHVRIVFWFLINSISTLFPFYYPIVLLFITPFIPFVPVRSFASLCTSSFIPIFTRSPFIYALQSFSNVTEESLCSLRSDLLRKRWVARRRNPSQPTERSMNLRTIAPSAVWRSTSTARTATLTSPARHQRTRCSVRCRRAAVASRPARFTSTSPVRRTVATNCSVSNLKHRIRSTMRSTTTSSSCPKSSIR